MTQTTGVLQNSCSEKFHRISENALVKDSYLSKDIGCEITTLLKKDPVTDVFLGIL